MTLKMAVFAPMQIASVAMAVTAKPLSFQRSLTPNLMSWSRVSMRPPSPLFL